MLWIFADEVASVSEDDVLFVNTCPPFGDVERMEGEMR
jgi:hypothetical protein